MVKLGVVSLFALSAAHDQLGLDGLQQFTGAHRLGGDIARHPLVKGTLVLATCNRFEVYVDADDADPAHVTEAIRHTQEAIARSSGDDSIGALTALHGDAAAHHLMRVTSGLESMIVGEREIRGQVRRALGLARTQRTVSDTIERLTSAALAAATAVGESTELGDAGRSAVDVALDLAGDIDWAGARAVLIGTGAYAGVSAARLRSRGVREISVHSVSGRAADFAASHDVDALPADGLVDALRLADVVVACRGHDAPSVTVADVTSALDGRDGRPLTVLDLSLRNDVEDGVAELPGVRVINLGHVSDEAPEAVEEHVAAAERVVETAFEEYRASRAERSLDDAIVDMRRKATEVLEREIARLPQEGSVDAAAVSHALRRLTNTLLHIPTSRAHAAARAGNDASFRAAITAVFGLDEETP